MRNRQRGSALVGILIFATVLAFLSSMVLSIVFSRATLFGQTRGRQMAQNASLAAFFKLKTCLDDNWDGAPGAFQSVFTQCQTASLIFGGRQYNFTYANSGSDPTKIMVTANDAF